VPSACPYCSVGCATLVHTVNGHIINIEGDPRGPHNEGTLCPKGAAIYQLHINPNRPTQVLHRAPGATAWEVWDLERAMDRVAELGAVVFALFGLVSLRKRRIDEIAEGTRAPTPSQESRDV
jgi:anaerobic selenocysteine-containing dehydrogenase